MANFEEAFNVVMSQPPIYFAGRRRELELLRDALVGGAVRKAVIVGAAGVGKTALVQVFIEQNREFFSGGVDRLPQVSSDLLTKDTVLRLMSWGNRAMLSGPKLLVMEEFDQYDRATATTLLAALQQDLPKIRIIATSRREVRGFDLKIQLGPLAADEMKDVWQSNLLDLSEDDYQKLYGRVGGNPLVSTLAGRLVRDGQTTVDEIVAHLRSFSAPGLVDPEGRPIRQGAPEEKPLISSLVVVTDDLLDRVRRSPEGIYSLTPRQFEELVAELFQRQGYDVTLTPRSKDGGKDLFVAKHDSVGSLMYLVECKRYAPDRPVGVGIVRQLYGVVEQEKATGGVLATTSFFTKGAKEFTEKVRYRLALKNYIELHKWIEQLRARQ
jgi:restriction system protein